MAYRFILLTCSLIVLTFNVYAYLPPVPQATETDDPS